MIVSMVDDVNCVSDEFESFCQLWNAQFQLDEYTMYSVYTFRLLVRVDMTTVSHQNTFKYEGKYMNVCV